MTSQTRSTSGNAPATNGQTSANAPQTPSKPARLYSEGEYGRMRAIAYRSAGNALTSVSLTLRSLGHGNGNDDMSAALTLVEEVRDVLLGRSRALEGPQTAATTQQGDSTPKAAPLPPVKPNDATYHVAKVEAPASARVKPQQGEALPTWISDPIVSNKPVAPSATVKPVLGPAFTSPPAPVVKPQTAPAPVVVAPVVKTVAANAPVAPSAPVAPQTPPAPVAPAPVQTIPSAPLADTEWAMSKGQATRILNGRSIVIREKQGGEGWSVSIDGAHVATASPTGTFYGETREAGFARAVGLALKAVGIKPIQPTAPVQPKVDATTAEGQSAIINARPAPVVVQPVETHSHTCEECGHSWAHGDDKYDDDDAHTCPKCGETNQMAQDVDESEEDETDDELAPFSLAGLTAAVILAMDAQTWTKGTAASWCAERDMTYPGLAAFVAAVRQEAKKASKPSNGTSKPQTAPPAPVAAKGSKNTADAMAGKIAAVAKMGHLEAMALGGDAIAELATALNVQANKSGKGAFAGLVKIVREAAQARVNGTSKPSAPTAPVAPAPTPIAPKTSPQTPAKPKSDTAPTSKGSITNVSGPYNGMGAAQVRVLRFLSTLAEGTVRSDIVQGAKIHENNATYFIGSSDDDKRASGDAKYGTSLVTLGYVAVDQAERKVKGQWATVWVYEITDEGRAALAVVDASSEESGPVDA